MADYPPGIYRKAAEAVEPGGSRAGEVIARAVLDAVAADLGRHAAAKIAAHRDQHGGSLRPDRLGAWRRHLGIAARIASGAFLTEDNLERMAAEALAAGQFVACPAPEDGTREH